jgi:hypothetical protein
VFERFAGGRHLDGPHLVGHRAGYDAATGRFG